MNKKFKRREILHKLGNHFLEFSKFFDRNGREIIITQVFNNRGQRITKGKAVCSKDDNFDKKFGRKKSISDALTLSEVPKEERALIWEDYRKNMTKTPRW